MNFDFGNLFRTAYLFETDPQGFVYSDQAFAVVFVLLLISFVIYVAAIRIKSLLPMQRRLLKDYARNKAILSLVLVLFLFFRSQGVNVLSMRIIPLIILVLMVINLGWHGVKFIKVKRVVIDEELKTSSTSEYQKYLPKRKKK